MEEDVKISFWKKLKISIFGLEDYQKLAVQKTGKTIGYLAKLMLIFAFILSIVLTYQFATSVDKVKEYIENQFEEISYQDGILKVVQKNNEKNPIVIVDEERLSAKFIIDTDDLTNEQVDKHAEEVKGYTNGIVILKDRIIVKTGMAAASTTVNLKDIADQYHVVKLDKQDILSMLSGSNIWMLYIAFFITMYIYLFIIYFSTVLIDALLYSLLGYIAGVFSRLRLKYSATYNIAVHALTVPIILNLIYIAVNMLTGYTIKYFDIMYMAITSIYVITAVLMIKSDVIKRQMELSKIISEQEKVKQELERKEQEKREEEEKERVRKEDEKKRKEEKQKKENENKGENNGPQPEANIKPNC